MKHSFIPTKSAYSAPECELSSDLLLSILCQSPGGNTEDFTEGPEIPW